MKIVDLSRYRTIRSHGRNASPAAVDENRRIAPITVILPFYNEAAFIEATLRSLLDQRLQPERIVLVDNGSTDGGAALCRAIVRNSVGLDVYFMNEDRPGKIFALEAANNRIATEFVCFCDADTHYPNDYFQRAMEIFDAADKDVVGVIATGLPHSRSASSGALRAKTAIVGRLLAKQCHSGGFGQIFRTRAYRSAGGYDSSIWPFVLEDQEIVHRLLSIGRIVYDANFWCEPSSRRKDRSSVTWSLGERLLYHLTPFKLKNWYFYDFLANRLRRRNLMSDALRVQPWAA